MGAIVVVVVGTVVVVVEDVGAVVGGVSSELGGPSQVEIINKRASTSAEVTVNSQRVLILSLIHI